MGGREHNLAMKPELLHVTRPHFAGLGIKLPATKVPFWLVQLIQQRVKVQA